MDESAELHPPPGNSVRFAEAGRHTETDCTEPADSAHGDRRLENVPHWLFKEPDSIAHLIKSGEKLWTKAEEGSPIVKLWFEG